MNTPDDELYERNAMLILSSNDIKWEPTRFNVTKGKYRNLRFEFKQDPETGVVTFNDRTWDNLSSAMAWATKLVRKIK